MSDKPKPGEDSRDLEAMEMLLQKEYKVCGVEVRHPSMSTFGVLRAGDSCLVSGFQQVMDLDKQPEIELVKFLVLLDAKRTSKQAYDLARDKDKLMEECMIAGDKLEYTDMTRLMEDITVYLHDATKNRVVVVKDDKKDEPLPNG